MAAEGKTDRIAWVDGLKGFAILCVVLGHTVTGYLGGGTYPEAEAALSALYNLLYAFHMPLFMLLSGYLFRAAYIGPEGGLRRERLGRHIGDLVVLYLLYCGAFGAVKLLAGRFILSPIRWTDLLLIPAAPLDLYWYLYALTVLTVLFSLEPVRRLGGEPKGRLVLLGAGTALCLLSVWVPWDAWFALRHVTRYALFFFLGILLRTEGDSRLFSGKTAAVLGGCALLLGALLWNSGTYLEDIPGVHLAVALGAALGLVWLFRSVPALGELRLLRLCGRYSLEIYLLHDYLTTAVRLLRPPGALAGVLLGWTVSTAVPVGIAVLARRLGLHGPLFRPWSFWRDRLSRREGTEKTN